MYLARSKIQGLGLYAKRDIDMNAMIIEYKGEVIRSEVSFDFSYLTCQIAAFRAFKATFIVIKHKALQYVLSFIGVLM